MRTPLWQFFSVAALGVSCSLVLGDLKETEKTEADVRFELSDQVQRLTIETFNGSLEIIERAPQENGGRNNTISGKSKIWASGNTKEDALAKVTAMHWQYRESGTEAFITLNRPSGRSGNSGGQLKKLMVPAGLAIHLDSSNGNIDFTGACEDFDLKTSNGRITVQLTSDWSGHGTANTSNGRIAVRCNGKLDCAVDMATSNGTPKVLGPPLSADSGTGSLRLRTSNGHITVTHLFDKE
jgi:hypothetical protein